MDAPLVKLTSIQILILERARSVQPVNTSQQTHVLFVPMENSLLPLAPYFARIVMLGSMEIQPRQRVSFVRQESIPQLVPI